ncbi:hypothetical protein [Streptomyces lavendulocolor]|uniref:hypothetical protein n=1 Tax=Streptomyces lavendulocolor TaxID=67316 RepID=UPI003C2D31E2
MTATRTQTAWPPNIIARYLTVAGSSLGREDLAVEVSTRYSDFTPPEPIATSASCTGCPAATEVGHWFGSGSHVDGTYMEDRDPQRAAAQAREWAQAHAEKCRAMPNPTA